MAKEKRNRESSLGKASLCANISTCELSWRGSKKCSKNCCRKYKDPKDPKNKK